MSRYTEVIVLARRAEKVMEPLTRPDKGRDWHQCFTRVDDSMFGGSRMPSDECYAWVIQFIRHNWHGLLNHLETLAWPDPHSVQVLVRDEDDDCFGLWMIYDGKLVEVSLPRTEREPFSASVTGVLSRTDRHAVGELQGFASAVTPTSAVTGA
ncbi:hypothetical protein [Streptomyces sp. CB03238]|uniref:hypothetical protein n=1 Tax=Streptomyces sp. CB03238 TaxID=1907777 RepID=UPI000A102FBC|nr:hypothetical protein [Streptomyces sp. CB03238]ORT56280.1 hypothetical protein BKD26_29415 [Streptomyces sp. CB03238]